MEFVPPKLVVFNLTYIWGNG